MPTPLVGMLLFIASEVMFFGGLFATYFNARAMAGPGNWHPPEGGHLDLPLAAVLTVILVASSFTMQFGVWAIRRGDTGKLRLWTAITLGLGVLFLAGQLYDYSQLGFSIADSSFGTVFYTLTGFHGAHVFGGAVGLTIILARTRARPVQRPQPRRGRGGQRVLALRRRRLDRRVQHDLPARLGMDR